MTRILAFSDMHMSRRCAADVSAAASEADIVIGAGDFCNGRYALDEAMEMLWTIEDKAIYVPGNAESVEELRAATTAPVLHGDYYEFGGLKIFGLGYAVPVTPFGAWSCDLTEEDATALLASMENADILISHSPPKCVVDRSSTGQSLGSTAIRTAIERDQPRLCLCGHIHDSRGQSGRIGATTVHNLGPFVTWFDL